MFDLVWNQEPEQCSDAKPNASRLDLGTRRATATWIGSKRDSGKHRRRRTGSTTTGLDGVDGWERAYGGEEGRSQESDDGDENEHGCNDSVWSLTKGGTALEISEGGRRREEGGLLKSPLEISSFLYDPLLPRDCDCTNEPLQCQEAPIPLLRLIVAEIFGLK